MILALDQGTTGSTALLVDRSGHIKGRGYREITQHYPKPGWVQHDANEIFQRTVEAGRAAIEQAGVEPLAIGITNQRETVVIWDRATLQPVAPAIVWQDRRTAQRCAELAPQSSEILRRTGLVVDAYFSATKLEWLLRDATLRVRAQRGELAAGTIDSWLIARLTNGTVHATDPTNASRTMLFDIDELRWSTFLCELFGVSQSLLPEVRDSASHFGSAAREYFGVALPIHGVAGDQQAALFGQGCWEVGEGKNTYGTGAFLLINEGKTRPAGGEGLLTTIACDEFGKPVFALEAAIFIAGAAVQWLRDGLGIIGSAAETEAMAHSLTSNDGVYFVPALVGLAAPHWNPHARGTIVGITRGTSRAHFARAALEAMAFGTRDVVECMTRQSGHALHLLRVDGGATGNDWLMQFQADVLGVPVERPSMIESTALGAAALAGIAQGVWRSPRDFLEQRTFTSFAPRHAADADQAYAGWQRAVATTLYWATGDAPRSSGLP